MADPNSRPIRRGIFAKPKYWRLSDIDLCSSGNIAMFGYHHKTNRSCLCVYSLVDSSDSKLNPTLLYERDLKTRRDGWRRCISFIEADSSEILAAMYDEMLVIDYKRDLVVRSCRVDEKIWSLSVSRCQIYIGPFLSHRVLIYDKNLQKIKSIILEGIRESQWPDQITPGASANTMLICLSGESFMYDQDTGRKTTIYTTGEYRNKANSIAVSFELGLIAVLCNQVEITFYLIAEDEPFLTVRISFLNSKVKISDKGLIVTGTHDNGEVKIYSLVTLYTYGHLKNLLSQRLRKSDCARLANFFELPTDQINTIMKSDTRTMDLLAVLEEKKVIQPTDIERLSEALTSLKINSFCCNVAAFYQKSRNLDVVEPGSTSFTFEYPSEEYLNSEFAIFPLAEETSGAGAMTSSKSFRQTGDKSNQPRQSPSSLSVTPEIEQQRASFGQKVKKWFGFRQTNLSAETIADSASSSKPTDDDVKLIKLTEESDDEESNEYFARLILLASILDRNDKDDPATSAATSKKPVKPSPSSSSSSSSETEDDDKQRLTEASKVGQDEEGSNDGLINVILPAIAKGSESTKPSASAENTASDGRAVLLSPQTEEDCGERATEAGKRRQVEDGSNDRQINIIQPSLGKGGEDTTYSGFTEIKEHNGRKTSDCITLGFPDETAAAVIFSPRFVDDHEETVGETAESLHQKQLSAWFGKLMVAIAGNLTLDNTVHLAVLFNLPPSLTDTLYRISHFQTPGIKLLNEIKDRNIINMYDVTNLSKAMEILELNKIKQDLIDPYQQKIENELREKNKANEIFTWDALKDSPAIARSEVMKQLQKADAIGTPNDQSHQTLYCEHNVGRDGGIIHLGGATLFIPSEALHENYAIGFSIINKPSFPIPSEVDKGRMTPLLRLEPVGLMLNKPLKLTIPHAARIENSEEYDIRIYSRQNLTTTEATSESTTWTEESSSQVELKENFVTFNIQCLSYFFARFVSRPSIPPVQFVRAVTLIDGVRNPKDDIKLTLCFCRDNDLEYNSLLSDYKTKLPLEQHLVLPLRRNSNSDEDDANCLRVNVSSLNNTFTLDRQQTLKTFAVSELCTASRVTHQLLLKRNKHTDKDCIDVVVTFSQTKYKPVKVFLNASLPHGFDYWKREDSAK